MKNRPISPISMLLVLCILFSLSACGKGRSFVGPETPPDKGAGMATNTNTQVSQIPGPEVEDPHHSISAGAEIEIGQPTTVEPAQPAGQYTYTIYDGVVINMDINVDDYIITNNAGQKVFKIYDLAHDKLGWEGNEPGDIAYRSNRYTLDQNQVYLIPWTDTQQLRKISYGNSGCEFAARNSGCEYMLSGTRYMTSYDDLVLLSYTFWLATTNSESNPFEVFSGYYPLGGYNGNIDVKLP